MTTMVASSELAGPLAAAMDGQSLNRAQARTLFNPDPECNSAAERIVALCREYGVPQQRMRDVLADIAHALRLNDAELDVHAAVAGDLDRLARRLHAGGARSALTVKQIARIARPALTSLRRPGCDPVDFCHAAWQIRDLFGAIDAEHLFTRSVRNELGKQPYQQLQALHASYTAGGTA